MTFGRICRDFSVLLLLVLLASGTGPAERRVAAQEPTPRIEPPLRPAWEARFPGEGNVQAVEVQDDVVYLLTGEGIVHALAAGDGRSLWETSGWLVPEARRCPYDPPKLEGVTNPYPEMVPRVWLASDGDALLVPICAGWSAYSTDQQLLILNRSSGELKASWPVIGGQFAGVHDGVVVIGSGVNIIGVDHDRLREVWRISPSSGETIRLVAVAGPVAFVNVTGESFRTHTSGWRVADGIRLWETSPEKSFTPRAWRDGLAYDVIEDLGLNVKELVAFDIFSGVEVWRAGLDGLEHAYAYALSVTTQGDQVYVHALYPPGGLAAFDAVTGRHMWTKQVAQGIRDVRFLDGTVCYVSGEPIAGDMRLYAVQADTGEDIWSGLPAVTMSLGPAGDGMLYVATSQPGMGRLDAVLKAMSVR